MYVDYNGQTYAFKFMHNTEEQVHHSFGPDGMQVIVIPRQTACIVTVKNGDKWEPVTVQTQEGDNIVDTPVIGYARVHPNDKNFIKETGRQVSLGNALKQFIPKEDRLKFWEVYANWKTPKPRLQLSSIKQVA